MAQADIGINIFLIDSFTSPMGLVEGAMGLFASTLISQGNAVNAAADAIEALNIKYSEQQAALGELMLDEDMYNAQLAAGLITQDEYDVAMADNAIAQQAMMENIDATTLSIQAQGDAMQAAGLQATEMGAALGGGVMLLLFGGALADATKQAGNLQEELAKLSIAGNLSSGQMQQMTQYLYDLAGSSMFAATDVADGFSLMLEKGQSATDVMNYLGQAMVNLAEATGQDGTAGAAALLGNVLQIWQMKASEAKNVTDELTYAFYHGIPDINGLTAAINNVGGMAHAMNVPFSETVTVLDALGRAGLSGSQAGTALRYMLQSMYEPTQKQANELQYLGIITAKQATPAFLDLLSAVNKASAALGSSTMKFDGTVNSLYNIFKQGQQVGTIPLSSSFLQWADGLGMLNNKFYTANGQQKDFLTAFGTLVDSIRAHSKTPQAFADSMAQMFNVKSGQGFADIVDQLGGLSQKQKDLIKSTYNMGLASEDAQKRMSTMPSQMSALGTTFQHFMGIVGLPFAQNIQNIAGSINTFLTGIIDKHPQLMQIMGVVLAVGAAAGAIVLVAGIITLLGAALGAISLPILLVVGGIALLALGIGMLVHWIQTSQPAMAGFNNLMNILKGVAQLVANFFMSQMKPAMAQLQDAWKQLWTAIQPLLPTLEMVGKILLALVGGIILAIVIGAIVALRVAIWVLSEAMIGISLTIKNMGAIFSWLGTVGHTVAKALTDNWHNATSQIGGFFSGLGTFIQNFIKGAEQWGINLVNMFINGIMSKFAGLKNAVGNIAGTIKNLLGFGSPTKEGPGADSHTWMPNMMNMFVHGIVSATPQLSAAAHGAALGIRSAFTSPSITSAQGIGAGVGGGSGSGPGVIQFCVDGKVYTEVAIQGLTKQMVATGVQKVLR